MDTSIIGRKYGSATEKTYVKTGKGYTDPNEAKVYSKLAQLNDAMNKSATSQTNNADNTDVPNQVTNASVNSNDVDRLEQMMNTMNQKDGADPEMQQLNGMLEKILDIQHPDRVQESLKQNSEIKKGQVFPVVANYKNDPVSLLDNRGFVKPFSDTGIYKGISQNGFFSLDDSADLNNSQNADRSGNP